MRANFTEVTMTAESKQTLPISPDNNTRDKKIKAYIQKYVVNKGYEHELIEQRNGDELHIFSDPKKENSSVELKYNADGEFIPSKVYRKKATKSKSYQDEAPEDLTGSTLTKENIKPTRKKKSKDDKKYKAFKDSLDNDGEDIDSDGGDETYDPVLGGYNVPEKDYEGICLRKAVLNNHDGEDAENTLSPAKPGHVRKHSEVSGNTDETLNDSAFSSASSGASEDGDDRSNSLPEATKKPVKKKTKTKIKLPSYDGSTDSDYDGGDNFDFGFTTTPVNTKIKAGPETPGSFTVGGFMTQKALTYEGGFDAIGVLGGSHDGGLDALELVI